MPSRSAEGRSSEIVPKTKGSGRETGRVYDCRAILLEKQKSKVKKKVAQFGALFSHRPLTMDSSSDSKQANQAIAGLVSPHEVIWTNDEPAEPARWVSFFRTTKGLGVAAAAVLVLSGGQRYHDTHVKGRAIASDVSIGSQPSVSTLHTRSTNTTVITSDAHFYGQSPPVYPSRMLSAHACFCAGSVC